MNRYIEAKLVKYDTIHILMYNPNKNIDYIFTLINGINNMRIKINGKIISSNDKARLYEFKLGYELELGNEYHISITNLGIYPLNVNDITLMKDFDERFYYGGNDLGATYNKNATAFALWAPLASYVLLLVDDKDAYYMKRTDKGVFRVVVPKDLKGHYYNYYVTNSGITKKTIDPYAKASLPNSKASVILDLEELKMNMNDDKLPFLNSNLDAIIYEGHVRDLTIDPTTNIVHKGKFLGLVEEGRVNKDGISVGFDYIKSLGITHLQLLPIYDFATTDEINPNNSYNWGYDPSQYFVPEGSYASNPTDPKSRIVDLLKLVSSFHSAGIRIVMDVVFNHVYEHQHSSFEAVVPNYFFRRNKDSTYFNSSGCGNDFASERLMARKLIVDATKFWASFYHIDGYRFDLMGLIDVETINLVRSEVRLINPNFMFYGEGWNMQSGYNLILANSDNYLHIPGYAFFNDMYRDTIVGNLYNHEPGFGLDNINYRDTFKEVFAGSSFNINRYSRFNDICYSLNFVECHDNNTLFDKISIIKPDLSLETKLQRVNFINSLVMFSLGIPFFHAGEEIGLTKHNNGNTYNAGDEYNMFDYSLLKERSFMIAHFQKIAAIRNNLNIFHEANMDVLEKDINFVDVEHGGIVFTYDTFLKSSNKKERIYLFINPTDNEINYQIDGKNGKMRPIEVRVDKGNL